MLMLCNSSHRSGWNNKVEYVKNQIGFCVLTHDLKLQFILPVNCYS